MKMILKLLALLALPLCLWAQPDTEPALQERLKGKVRFRDIYNEVEQFYREEKLKAGPSNVKALQAIDRKRKMWNRWKHYYEGRLQADGTIPNMSVKNYEMSQMQVSTVTNAELAGDVTLADPSSAQWNSIGPSSISNGAVGRVNRIAFHPSNQNILYVGTPNSGLWRSTDAGFSWTCLNNYAPTLGVSGIVVSHATANTIYVLTGDGDSFRGSRYSENAGFHQRYGYADGSMGVMKSTDGGTTWQRCALFRLSNGNDLTDDINYSAHKIIQSPADANILLVATSYGIFRTTNGGSSWTQVSVEKKFYDLEFQPGNSSIVYASATGSAWFYRSTDGGQSFSQVSSGLPTNADVSRAEIAVTPANSQYVYLLAGPGRLKRDDNSNDTFVGVYRSTNGGTSFSLRADSPDVLGFDGTFATFAHQSAYDLALAAHPGFANTILTGGLVMWQSTDGGVSYNEETDYFRDLNNSDWIHPDIHDIAYHPLNPSKIYACTDGGVFVSTDNAYSWSTLNTGIGLGITQFYKMEIASEDYLPWGGTQDNGTVWKQSGSTIWNDFDGGDGYDVLTDIEQDDKFWIVNTEIWTDGVADINVTPDQIAGEFFPNLAKSYSVAEVIYTGNSSTLVSFNQGDDWIEFRTSQSATVGGGWALRSCKSNDMRLYAAGINKSGTAGLWRVDNTQLVGVTSVARLDGSSGFPGSFTKITGIGVHPSNADRVWVTIGGFEANKKVFYSSDAGVNWTNISGTLPNVPINCIEVTNAGSLIIGTDIGVFIRTSSMSDWKLYNNNLPRVPVTDLDILVVGNSSLFYAATFGRGVWSTTGDFTCDADVAVNDATIGGLRSYQASNTLTATSAIVGGVGSDVSLSAGTLVDLNPGFDISSGGTLEVTLGPCNTGGLAQTGAVEMEPSAKTVDATSFPSYKKLSLNRSSRRKTKR